ncbi:hypothetical protein IQ06DRAFT_295855 [Phaeosphaeriaceae sp. SRC1lsM3a]|nr:hypothetical protein IQ06DRAFT_295855 [Stagonospora sp. SRC1lsM3a]
MDRLPFELATIVMNNLIEYENPCTHYPPEDVEQPLSSCDHFRFHEWMFTNWLLLKQTSIATILHARLSCSSLYHASHPSYAILLGDRTFRYTNSSIEALLRIGQKPEIARFITTITIGCAGLRYPCDTKQLRHAFQYLSLSDNSIKAYERCAKWQHNEVSMCKQRLTQLLKAFPNLTAVRIHTGLSERSSDAWLQAGASRFDGGMLYEKFDTQAWTALYRMYELNTVPIDSVIGALKDAGTTLEDFRISLLRPPGTNHSLFRYGLPSSNLHTLCITSPHGYYGLADFSETMARILVGAPNLRDVTIRTVEDCRYGDTTSFFDALMSHTKLRRVCFMGFWILHQKDLVEFASLHAHSLRCLIFDESILCGSWSETIRAIGHISQGQLEYFRATDIKENPPDSPIEGHARKFALERSDFEDFLCPVDWSVFKQ